MPVNQQANQQLAFLQDKIQQIGSAIFFNLSDSVLKLPTSVVTSLKVDDYGYIWFFIKKPNQQLQEFEQEFPVRLDFFKKGVDYFLQVSGKGWVVSDPEDLNTYSTLFTDVDPSAATDSVLVKVKMLKAEYYETASRAKHSWWYNAVSAVTTWFRSSHHMGNTYYPAS
jgi:general stress protein 26